MSDRAVTPPTEGPATRSRRGQSLVEFALVLPMLLVLLLGIADFGRGFHAGITVEAAARNAAESASQEYLQLARAKVGGVLDAADYGALHGLAVRQACDELRLLPNSHAPDGTCSVPVAVCIHDAGASNPGCGGATSATCSGFDSGLSTVLDPGSNGLVYVEVRICYRFRTLAGDVVVSLPFGAGIDMGDVPILKSRTFAVADY